MFKIINAILLSCFLIVVKSQTTNYDNFQLVEIRLETDDQVKLVHDLEDNDSEFDIWNIAKKDLKVAIVLLSPKAFAKYTKLFDNLSIKYQIVENNIQNKINEQARSMVRSKNDRSILLKYARYTEILSFIDSTVAANSDIASSYIYGKTHENRNLKAIVLKTSTATRSIWIDCGIHAFINEYRSGDPKTVAIMNKFEIHVTPLLNPDGYEYSHTTSRLWRKNRSPNQICTCVDNVCSCIDQQFSSCLGTDLNRNFPFRWLTGGSSSNPCSEVYAGNSAGSEKETQAVIKAIRDKSGQWDAFISVHSYGCWWLTQWGHSPLEVPDDNDDIISKAKIGADEIKRFNGSDFIVGSSSQLLYVNTGSSGDWAKGNENIKYSYVIELRPGPGTSDYYYGFTLPEDRMVYVAPENFLGIKTFLSAIV